MRTKLDLAIFNTDECESRRTVIVLGRRETKALQMLVYLGAKGLKKHPVAMSLAETIFDFTEGLTVEQELAATWRDDYPPWRKK